MKQTTTQTQKTTTQKRAPRFQTSRLSAETVDVRTISGGKIAVTRLLLDDGEVIWTATGEKTLTEMLDVWGMVCEANERIQEHLLIGHLTRTNHVPRAD